MKAPGIILPMRSTAAFGVEHAERKQAERQLRLLDTVLDAAAAAIVITDEMGRITWVNPAFTSLTGYPSAEAIGHTPRLLRSGAHDPSFYAALWRTILSGEIWRGEITNRRKDGRLYTTDLTIAPVRDDLGCIVHFVGISHDITERRQCTRELRHSEERFSKVFRSNAAAIGIATMDDGRLIDVNDRCAEFFGYRREELVGRTVGELGLWADPGDRARVIGLLRRSGSVQGIEARFRQKSGTLRDALLSMEILEIEGEAVSLAMFVDITERKDLETQLRQSQKMEAVGHLAGGVAHDFNNMLTVIIGRLQLVRLRLRSGDPLDDDVTLIEQTALRAAALTRQLLAFSRKQVLQPKELDLDAVVGEMGPMLRRLIGERFELALAHTTGLDRVMADPAQFEQVLMNLVLNARDAMPAGGRISVATENIRLDEAFVARHPGSSPGPHVMLAVSDTGIGMSPEVQVQIFEPFYTTKEAGKGTGLGLSTVYGIVKQHGGHIAVESEPGSGATFRVYLPSVERLAPSIEAMTAAAPETRGAETILLVEDEPLVRLVTRDMLELRGYKVLEAADTSDALRIADPPSARIDLLVTDVIMPGMNGPDLALLIRGRHPRMRILYISGYTDPAMGNRITMDPDTAFLQKPFTPDSLALKVREVLDGGGNEQHEPRSQPALGIPLLS